MKKQGACFFSKSNEDIIDITAKTKIIKSETQNKKKDNNKTNLFLKIIVVTSFLLISRCLYIWIKQNFENQIKTNAIILSKIDALQKAQKEQKFQIGNIVENQKIEFDKTYLQQKQTEKQMEIIRQKIENISNTDSNGWLLHQADFLIKLARHKLWIDKDIITAIALLKTADSSLDDMNDPNLIIARNAISKDIEKLSRLPQVDHNDIMFKLYQLSDRIETSFLTKNDENNPHSITDINHVHNFFNKGYCNLKTIWDDFTKDFIKIHRRKKTTFSILEPNQNTYLHDNIHLNLLIAAQAVPRSQEETYKQALSKISRWIHIYCDTKNSDIITFLSDINNLIEKKIKMNLPDQLESQSTLENLIKIRMQRNFLEKSSTQ